MKRGRKNNEFPENGFELWGGYMNAKIAKLEEQFLEQAAKEVKTVSGIFEGISIFVNGYTKPSATELKILMAEHGGVYHHYFKSDMTKFIIASNLPDSKVKNLPTTKIVKPQWISDSIKAESLLDYKDYLLYSNHSKTQPRLNFNNHHSIPKSDISIIQNSKQHKETPTLIDSNSKLCNEHNDVNIDQNLDEYCKATFDKNKQIGINTEVDTEFCASTAFDTLSLCASTSVDTKSCVRTAVDTQSCASSAVDTKSCSAVDVKARVSTAVDSKLCASSAVDTVVDTKARASTAVDTKSCASTAVDPNFLSEFYNNSRLHHISQLGAGFKKYVNDLRQSSSNTFPFRDFIRKIKNQTCDIPESISSKTIMHIDMDCFFVSVGLRKHPHLRGLPVAVTHSKGGAPKQTRDGVNRLAEFNMYKNKKKNKLKRALGKGVQNDSDSEDIDIVTRVDGITDQNDKYGSMSEIASCSYEARALGLHNGMFMGAALRLCPTLKTIPYDFDAYKEVAFILYDTVAQYTLDIEAVSCDEMYVDCTELLHSIGMTPLEFATIIREQIKVKTGCPCSTGFGSNRLQARLATKKAKPDGQYHLLAEDVETYFSEVALGDLPGVGYQMKNKLTALGYTNCGSLRLSTLNNLQKHFGNKTGSLLYNYCRGIDERPLNFTTVRKSISAGVNYGIRFEDSVQCEKFLKQLCQEIQSRMSQNNVTGKAITVKLMIRAADAPVETAKFMGHGFCDNISKTSNLSQATDNLETITREVIDICKKLNIKPEEMRGISIQVSKLENVKINNKKVGIQNFLKLKSELPSNKCNEINEKADKLHDVISPKHNITANRTVEEENINIQGNIKENDSHCYKKDEIHHKTNIPESKIKSNTLMDIKEESPTKKGKSLGLTRRRRGRPPKHLETTYNKRETNKFIDSFLKTSNNSTNNSTLQYNLGDLDQEFLNALPDDIKSEVLASCKTIKHTDKNKLKIISPIEKSKKICIPNSKMQIDPDYLAALPEDIRVEIESNLTIYENLQYPKVDNKIGIPKTLEYVVEMDDNTKEAIEEQSVKTYSHKSSIIDRHWKEIREMLKYWFKSSDSPMQCDIDMIVYYVQNLVIQRNIEDLDYLLKFFYRMTHDEMKDQCTWHRIYLEIEAKVQETMIIVYRKKLHTYVSFSCCNL